MHGKNKNTFITTSVHTNSVGNALHLMLWLRFFILRSVGDDTLTDLLVHLLKAIN